MSEEKTEKPKEVKKPKKNYISLALHQEFAQHLFRVNRMKPGKKYKFEASYKELESKVKGMDGLKAKSDKTIAVKGRIFRLTKDYPNPMELKTTIETLHNEKAAKKILNDLFEL